jgi:hypothetical protein
MQVVRGSYCAVMALMVMVCVAPARAQTADPPLGTSDSGADASSQSSDDAADTRGFFPRAAFHMAAEHLWDDDPRFVWDADFGGELDIVDYGVGRFTFEANYGVVLGEEIRVFDPNQGNYILAGLVSARAGKTEVAAELYHQSRHLADRPKEEAVDWNMLGGRVQRRFSYDQATFDARADLRGVYMKTTVDYSWEIDAAVRSDVKLRRSVGLLAMFDLRYLGVDGSRGRGNQTGYRAEGGVRFEGRAGAIELFLAGERRIDPYPLEAGIAQWASAGFRLLSR